MHFPFYTNPMARPQYLNIARMYIKLWKNRSSKLCFHRHVTAHMTLLISIYRVYHEVSGAVRFFVIISINKAISVKKILRVFVWSIAEYHTPISLFTHIYIEDICWFWCNIVFYFTSGHRKWYFHEWRSHEGKYRFSMTTSEMKYDITPESTNFLFILCTYIIIYRFFEIRQILHPVGRLF